MKHTERFYENIYTFPGMPDVHHDLLTKVKHPSLFQETNYYLALIKQTLDWKTKKYVNIVAKPMTNLNVVPNKSFYQVLNAWHFVFVFVQIFVTFFVAWKSHGFEFITCPCHIFNGPIQFSWAMVYEVIVYRIQRIYSHSEVHIRSLNVVFCVFVHPCLVFVNRGPAQE